MTTATLRITPTSRFISSHKTGRLTTSDKAAIVRCLGFEPSFDDDPDKVEYIWRFDVERADGTTAECAIWDYKGVRWSTFGPDDIMQEIFGAAYSAGPY